MRGGPQPRLRVSRNNGMKWMKNIEKYQKSRTIWSGIPSVIVEDPYLILQKLMIINVAEVKA